MAGCSVFHGEAGLLATGTQIAVSAANTTPIEALQLGEDVLAAGLALDWKAAGIQFSDGTAPGPAFQGVRCEIEGDRELIGTFEQLILTTKGLVRMDMVRGGDRLIKADGQSAEVLASVLGKFTTGLHSVSTSRQVTTDPDGHLLIAAGFVVADQALCIGMRSGAKGSPAASLEAIGDAPPPA